LLLGTPPKLLVELNWIAPIGVPGVVTPGIIEEEIIIFPVPGGNPDCELTVILAPAVILVTPLGVYDAVVAKLELTASKTYEAVTAFKTVAKSEPVKDVAVKEPEIFTVFKAKSPFISGVPEPDAIYNLLLSSIAVEGPAPNPIAMLFDELPEKKYPACWPKAILFFPIVF